MMSSCDPSSRPVRKVFTSRAGGVSAAPYESFNLGDHVGDDPAAVRANRQRLAEILGLDPDRFVWMEQLHTANVTVVEEPQAHPVEATDAVVTTTPNLALCVVVADCVPVLLSDHEHGVIAAVHAGRPGARNGIVKKTIAVMEEQGAQVEKIHALLGPSISGKMYEVPAAMAQDVEQNFPGSACRTEKGTPGLDIKAGLIRQLVSLGVNAIDPDWRCTMSDTSFFSYRRDGKTGRQAGVIWIPAKDKA